MRVADLMSHHVITAGATDSVGRILALMQEYRVRHVPIVNGDDELEGIVSRDELVGVPPAMPAGDIMVRDPQTTESDADITDAAYLLIENEFGCLPVVERNNRVIGIVTERDFVWRVAAEDLDQAA